MYITIKNRNVAASSFVERKKHGASTWKVLVLMDNPIIPYYGKNIADAANM